METTNSKQNKQGDEAPSNKEKQQPDEVKKHAEQALLNKNEPVLTKENLPDSTNENKGQMGSGTRQDSN